MDSRRPLILVVEDDPDVATVLKHILESADFAAEHTNDGAMALARIEAGDVELILLDLMLPGIDGLELCRRVRARVSDVYVPIIMVTALTGEPHRLKGFEAGADDYISKPFSVDEVLARVQVWVRASQRLRAAHERLVQQQRALRAAERRAFAARLEGVTVTARELAHRVNNHLQGIIAVYGLLETDRRIPADAQALLTEAHRYADAAAAVILQLQQVVRVETRQTPVGPALDLDRSTRRDGR